MSISFEFVDQPNGGSITHDQLIAIHRMVEASENPTWFVRDRTPAGIIELEVWNEDEDGNESKHYLMDESGNVSDMPQLWIHEAAPEELVEGVNSWLRDHPEDPVAVTEDGKDALILTSNAILGDVEGVVWVDPEGTVRMLKGRFLNVSTRRTGL
jgi:hypothetical protein